MAGGYVGYSGYDPERAKVDRARQMAELLQQGATDTSPKSFWEGAAQLGKAFIARGAMDRADKAESAYGDAQKQKYAQLADTISGMMYQDTPAISSGAKTTFAPTGEAQTTPGGIVTPQQQDPRAKALRLLVEQGIHPLEANQAVQSMAPKPREFSAVEFGAGGVGAFDPTTGTMNTLVQPTAKPDAANIRQVGNQIVERQPDGSWKPVYTGSNAEETARAFQGFIDQATGEQMVVMSDGRAKSTGYKAYIPPQITSVGGVPTAVNKLDMSVTPLSPLQDVATNKAGIASAEVQGKAQGQAAFDLPTIEMRSQAAIDSIRDLRSRNIDARFGMQGKLYAIPGTEGADVQALVNQVTSQAFLNAFDQLRGAGAITEREGQAATQAITRLQNQNITVGEAMQAMSELDGYYRKGLEIARQRAVKAPVLPQAAVAGQTPQPVAQPTPAAPGQSWVAKQGQRFTSMAQPQQSADQPPPGIDPEDWKYMDDSQKALFR